MDSSRFDAIARSLAAGGSRRVILRAIAAGLAATLPLGASGKKKKPKKNAFGCLDVGKACRGKDKKCCSGICVGKKPKKGKKDKSRCVAHDATSCLAGQQSDNCAFVDLASCITSAGRNGQCVTTTGNAAYCRVSGGAPCAVCKKDVDCHALCGPQAACIPCAGCPEGTACAAPDSPGLPCAPDE